MEIKDQVKPKKHKHVYQPHIPVLHTCQTRVGQPTYVYYFCYIFLVETRENVEEHLRRSNAISKSCPLRQKLHVCLIHEYLLFDDC